MAAVTHTPQASGATSACRSVSASYDSYAAGVTPVVGWANRLLIAAYMLWVVLTAQNSLADYESVA